MKLPSTTDHADCPALFLISAPSTNMTNMQKGTNRILYILYPHLSPGDKLLILKLGILIFATQI